MTETRSKISGVSDLIVSPFFWLLEWTEERVNDKPKALKYMYLLSLFFIICNFCSSLFTIERCFYDPCIRGYGRDELNRVHYGLSINSLTVSCAYLTGPRIFGCVCCFGLPQIVACDKL